MTLQELKKEKIVYMKAKNKDAVNALNALINKVMLQTIEKRKDGVELTEGDIDVLIQKTEKELLEEQLAFKNAGRDEQVQALENQLEVIRKYLPKLLSDDEIAEIISKLDDKSIPSVMKYFKANYNGKVDMKRVNIILRKM